MTTRCATASTESHPSPLIHPYRRHCQQMNPAVYSDLLAVSTDMQPDGITWRSLYQVHAFVYMDSPISATHVRVSRFDRIRGIGMGAIGITLVMAVIVLVVKFTGGSPSLSQADLVGSAVSLGLLLIIASWYLQESYSILVAIWIAPRYRYLLEQYHRSLS